MAHCLRHTVQGTQLGAASDSRLGQQDQEHHRGRGARSSRRSFQHTARAQARGDEGSLSKRSRRAGMASSSAVNGALSQNPEALHTLLSNRNTRTQAVAFHNQLDRHNSHTASKQASALHNLLDSHNSHTASKQAAALHNLLDSRALRTPTVQHTFSIALMITARLKTLVFSMEDSTVAKVKDIWMKSRSTPGHSSFVAALGPR